MTEFDLTVALTLHSETVMAGPTMTSADIAIKAAEAAGIKVEKLIGFDTASEACVEYFSAPAFAEWNKIHFEFRDQGKTRNALVQNAQGTNLAFLDGDDLFSENWLVGAMECLRGASNPKSIVHPELNWIFDASAAILAKPAQDAPLFSPHYFMVANYYDALCLAPRETWLELPYADRAIAEGYAYEDWQWAIETMAAGWNHIVAKDTIIFKRRRDASQTIESSVKKASIRNIDAIAIDVVGKLTHRAC